MRQEAYFSGTTALRKILSLTVLLFLAKTGAAATMKIVELPATGTDAAIDISSEKTYTHTFDFGSSAPVTINGVAFEQVVEGVEIKDIEIFKDTSTQGHGYSIQDSRWFLTNPNYKFWLKNHEGGNKIDDYCDGKSHEMFNDFLYFDRAADHMGEGIIVTFKDLAPSTGYSIRYYYRPWDPPLPRPLTIYGDAESDSVFKDSIWVDIDTSRLGAQYIDYSFVTDDTDVVMKFNFHDEGQGPHLYGLTCEKLPQLDVGGGQSVGSAAYELKQVYSNPFNPNKTIQYKIPKAGRVRVSVLNSLGKQVAMLVNEVREAGKHSVEFNASNLVPGLYVCKMKVAEKSLFRKIYLLK